MAFDRRGISPKQLIGDYGMTLSNFTDQVDSIVAELTEAEASMPAKRRHQEVCTAIWAAITAAFDSSSLSETERANLNPLLEKVLIPYWQKHCASDSEMVAVLAERSKLYLQGRDPESQITTANVIVRHLFDEIGASESARARLSRTLVPLFAHRMLGDIHHINDVKTRLGIQLPMLAALCVTANLLALCDPLLKALRLG